ncbi:T9SS type A sorting domain-containing protein (plasmid) [Hymenobacter sp. 5317J-9]|uniref:T9SS type A sorting domain-containing protein n=1 Tax=Hymenobacter sp. 5317J-9 TaxID=2932250 RepID=UPI001FD64D8D|nr:T9SS type A sorting domain-containing protein [Hymenobacter sp. 5317J-9]UOR00200.1 T9SS type A sorting domain-containing protein [Hymenobacter sp. 5317J-9]
MATSGTYTATATDPATGCASTSNAVTVTVVLATATGRAAQPVLLYPNPTHGGAATLTGAAPGARVTVFDALGRQVLAATADASGTAALVLSAGQTAGVYVVRAGPRAVRLTVE